MTEGKEFYTLDELRERRKRLLQELDVAIETIDSIDLIHGLKKALRLIMEIIEF